MLKKLRMLKKFTNGISAAIILIAAVSAMGCSKDGSDEAKDPTKLHAQKIKTDGLDKVEQDINKDGKADQFIYKAGDIIRYAQHDFNFDGILDMTEFYDEKGIHTRDEIDLDYDGIVDLIVTYKNDLPAIKEYSIDFEGNRHGVQYFNPQGDRTEIRRDTDRDGIYDTAEYFRPGERTPYKTEKLYGNANAPAPSYDSPSDASPAEKDKQKTVPAGDINNAPL